MDKEYYQDMIYLLRMWSKIGYEYDEETEKRVAEKMQSIPVKYKGQEYNRFSEFGRSFFHMVMDMGEAANIKITDLPQLENYPELVLSKISELEEKQKELSGPTK